MAKERTYETVFCKGCRSAGSENSMGFYSVPEDRYYHNQRCHDAYHGILRDPEGHVISEGKRYTINKR